MKWFRALMKAVWPTTKCVICGGKSEERYPGLCRECMQRMEENRRTELFCPRCGSFRPDIFPNCPRCFLEPSRFSKRDGLFCAIPYDDDSSILVKKMKYNNRRDLAETMAKLFFRYSDVDDDFDMITAVPLHKERLRSRGYNQSEVFGRYLAQGMELPFDMLLERIVNTPSQTTLTYHQRLKNMEGAFAVADWDKVCGKRILLVDDVLTTGTTTRECASILKKAGAKRVGIATFAAGKVKESY